MLDWLLDSDPSIRWQTLQDLVDAPAEVVPAERAPAATDEWGDQLLAVQGEDGQWEGGALDPESFPSFVVDRESEDFVPVGTDNVLRSRLVIGIRQRLLDF